jgi:hypothetical protein
MKRWIVLGMCCAVGGSLEGAQFFLNQSIDNRERLSKENLRDFLKAQQRKALWSSRKESATKKIHFPSIHVKGNRLFIDFCRSSLISQKIVVELREGEFLPEIFIGDSTDATVWLQERHIKACLEAATPSYLSLYLRYKEGEAFNKDLIKRQQALEERCGAGTREVRMYDCPIALDRDGWIIILYCQAQVAGKRVVFEVELANSTDIDHWLIVEGFNRIAGEADRYIAGVMPYDEG